MAVQFYEQNRTVNHYVHGAAILEHALVQSAVSADGLDATISTTVPFGMYVQ